MMAVLKTMGLFDGLRTRNGGRLDACKGGCAAALVAIVMHSSMAMISWLLPALIQ